MKRAAMVALACLTDAYIGALIADELATRFGWGIYAWPVGALLGGSIAYIIHDIKAFCSGIKRAFDEVTGWQPDVQWWKAYAKAVLYFGGMPSGIVFWMVASMGFTIDLYAKAPTFNWLFVAFYASLLVFLICFLISFTLSAGEEREKLEKTAQRIKKIFRYTNHIALPF